MSSMFCSDCGEIDVDLIDTIKYKKGIPTFVCIKCDNPERYEKLLSYTCVLCEKTFKGDGNNPWPLAENGLCCSLCNKDKVIPARVNSEKN